MNYFPFILNSVLQSNLNLAQDHIIDLTALSESNEYKNRRLFVSSLRKTIIILTASTIEALLLWKLKEIHKINSIELVDEWKYLNIKTIYTISLSEEVITGIRKKEKKDMEKLDFIRIIDLSVKHKIIRSSKLKLNVNAVRKLRNRLHIGGLAEIEKEYKPEDLEFCFKIAKKVREIVSR